MNYSNLFQVAIFFGFYGFLNMSTAILALVGLLIFAVDELHKNESDMTYVTNYPCYRKIVRFFGDKSIYQINIISCFRKIICKAPTYTNVTNRPKYLSENKFICPNCKFYDICPYAMVNDFCKESQVNDHLHTIAKTFVYPTIVFLWCKYLLY